MGFPGGEEVKNLPANAGDTRDMGLIPGLRRSPGIGNGNQLPAFLPGKFHGQRGLVCYNPWDCKESDMIEHIDNMHIHMKPLKPPQKAVTSDFREGS